MCIDWFPMLFKWHLIFPAFISQSEAVFVQAKCALLLCLGLRGRPFLGLADGCGGSAWIRYQQRMCRLQPSLYYYSIFSRMFTYVTWSLHVLRVFSRIFNSYPSHSLIWFISSVPIYTGCVLCHSFHSSRRRRMGFCHEHPGLLCSHHSLLSRCLSSLH